MKGRTFLKVTGILMIIGGSIGIIGGILAVIGASALASVLETNSSSFIFAGILILIGAIIQLVAGIMGVKNCARPEKAQSCIVMGVLVALFSIIGNIISTVSGNSFSVMSLITGLIVPVLYIIGAVLNKKEA